MSSGSVRQVSRQDIQLVRILLMDYIIDYPIMIVLLFKRRRKNLNHLNCAIVVE